MRIALAGTPAWLVGGAPRDRVLGRETFDLDVVVDGSAASAAQAIARAAGGAACFELSEEFSGWRVVARDHSWQVDVQPMRGGSLTDDLVLRDFTVGAIAEPVAGGGPVDPLGGLTDLYAGRLRMVSAGAFADDPLRVLRLVRLALELELAIDPDTARAARAAAPALAGVAGERMFMELRRIIASPRALDGIELMATLGATAAALPELETLRGVGRSRCERDLYSHTLVTFEWTIALQRDPAKVLGEGQVGDTQPGASRLDDAQPRDAQLGDRIALGEQVTALLAEPLADELTRGDALRWGALLADTGGAEIAREALGRLRTSERLRAHVAALVRHHLRLGFLLHDPQPLARRTVFDYLQATAPVEVDVTLLSIADRLAGRSGRAATGGGEQVEKAVVAHMRLARAMLADALRWRAAGGAPGPLWRGDELATALGLAPGPRLGELLAELAAAQYAGEVTTREQALDHARRLVDAGTI